MSEPREYTEDEVREKFLKYCWSMVYYWENLPDKTTSEKLSGLMFSLLSTLDGSSMELPSFIVAPLPHPGDKEYLKGNGENWFPENNDESINADIGGSLHENFYRFNPKQEG
jgi:hypothetical protein